MAVGKPTEVHVNGVDENDHCAMQQLSCKSRLENLILDRHLCGRLPEKPQLLCYF